MFLNCIILEKYPVDQVYCLIYIPNACRSYKTLLRRTELILIPRSHIAKTLYAGPSTAGTSVQRGNHGTLPVHTDTASALIMPLMWRRKTDKWPIEVVASVCITFGHATVQDFPVQTGTQNGYATS